MKRLMWYLAAAICLGYGLERLAEWTVNWAPAMPAADITYEGSGVINANEFHEGAFDQITSGTNTSPCLSSSNAVLFDSGTACGLAPPSCAPGEYAAGVNASGFAQCYRPAPPGSRQ